jgi:aryl-alcohol dehydrogenase-like predicted oxidoreductase
MKTRKLGASGPEVSAIGLGCMPMSGVYGVTSDEDGIATINRALDLGITLLDTADAYGDGHNERLVGRAVQGRRDEVVLATKFGSAERDEQGNKVGGFNSRPEYVKRSCEYSLRRLGVEHIDLFQQHRVDPEVPIEETVGALVELIEAGKIRHYGLSEAEPPDIARAAAVHPVASVQSEYSLLERGVEQGVLAACEAHGVGFLPFSPLVRGLLAGSLTVDTQLTDGDVRAQDDRFPRVGPEHLAANAALAAAVHEVAAEHGATGGQVALAWLLGRAPWIVPIPGTKRVAYVEDNAGAVELTLTSEDQARLEDLAGRVSGTRYGGPDPDWVSPPLQPK